jgi:hypothetical protein
MIEHSVVSKGDGLRNLSLTSEPAAIHPHGIFVGFASSQ